MTTLTSNLHSATARIFSQLRSSCLIFDSSLTIVFASDAILSLLGKNKENFIGRTAESINELDYTDSLHSPILTLYQSVRDVLGNGISTRIELLRFDVPLPDGTVKERYWNVYNDPIFSEAGKVEFIIHTIEEITKEQELLTELEENKEHFALLAKLDNVVIYDWDIQNQITWRNKGFAKLLGLHEKLGFKKPEAWRERLHPDERDQILAQLFKTFEDKKSDWHCHYRLRKEDNTYIDIVDQAGILYNEIGKPYRMVGTVIDVTAQKEAENKVKNEAAKFKALVEMLPEIVFVSNNFGELIYANRNFNFSNEENIEKYDWLNLISLDEKDQIAKTWKNCVLEKSSFSAECKLLVNKERKYKWHLGRAIPILNENKEVECWIGMWIDIDEAKQNQIRVEEAFIQFRFLADLVPHLVWTTDQRGNFDFLNKRWKEYSGITLPEVNLTLAWNTIIHPSDQEVAYTSWQRSLETGSDSQFKVRLRGKNNNWRWFLGKTTVLKEESGLVIKGFGTFTDIQESKELEDELIQKNNELKRINKNLDSFVYRASHDLKLPLANMEALFNELLGEIPKLSQEAKQLAQYFRVSHKLMKETLEELVDLVKVHRLDTYVSSPADISSLIKEIKLELRDLFKDSNAKVRTSQLDIKQVYFPNANLKSILINLISNSLKYRELSRNLIIDISSQRENGQIRLTIEDNGLGMDLNVNENLLFKKFSRFHEDIPGTGLGLYIVKQIIEANGGTISIESEIGKGTKFTIYLNEVFG